MIVMAIMIIFFKVSSATGGCGRKPGPGLLPRMTYWREVLERQIEFGSGEFREFEQLLEWSTIGIESGKGKFRRRGSVQWSTNTEGTILCLFY